MAGIGSGGIDLASVYHGSGSTAGRLDSSNYFRWTNTQYSGAPNSQVRGHDIIKLNWSTIGDNTWRTLIEGFNDSRGYLDIWGGDAASMDRKRYSFAVTSPGYGVGDWDQEMYYDGGWNTGAFNIQLVTVGSNFNVNFQFSSYYNSSNRAYFYAHWRGVYG